MWANGQDVFHCKPLQHAPKKNRQGYPWPPVCQSSRLTIDTADDQQWSAPLPIAMRQPHLTSM